MDGTDSTSEVLLDVGKDFQIKSLNDEIERLTNKLTKYEILMKEAGMEDFNKIDITDEEIIAVRQIQRLKEYSDERDLTLDEVKMYDTLHKNLKLSRGGNPRVGKKGAGNKSTEEKRINTVIRLPLKECYGGNTTDVLVLKVLPGYSRMYVPLSLIIPKNRPLPTIKYDGKFYITALVSPFKSKEGLIIDRLLIETDGQSDGIIITNQENFPNKTYGSTVLERETYKFKNGSQISFINKEIQEERERLRQINPGIDESLLEEFEKMLSEDYSEEELDTKTLTNPDRDDKKECGYHHDWEITYDSPFTAEKYYNCKDCGIKKEEWEKNE